MQSPLGLAGGQAHWPPSGSIVPQGGSSSHSPPRPSADRGDARVVTGLSAPKAVQL